MPGKQQQCPGSSTCLAAVKAKGAAHDSTEVLDTTTTSTLGSALPVDPGTMPEAEATDVPWEP